MTEGGVVMALIDALWQGAVVALAAGGILRFVRTNAATRYAVWSAVLVVLTILPVADLVSAGPRIAHAIPPLASHASAAYLSRPARPRVPGASMPKAGEARARAAHVPAAPLAQPPRGEPMPAFTHPLVLRVTRTSIRLALAFLAAISFLRICALIRGYVRLRAIVKGAMPFERPLPVAIARPVRLVTSDAVAVPVAVGLGDAAIVLPTRVLLELSEEDLDQILLHEAAHLARRDDLTNLVQRAVAAMLFFHPAIHAVARRLDLEREIACDDWVIASTGRRRPYAFCLTKLAELALGSARRPFAALGLFASRRALRTRVEHLLDASADAIPRRTRFATVAVAAVVALAAGIGALRLPVVATPLDAPQAAPHNSVVTKGAPAFKIISLAPLPERAIPIVRAVTATAAVIDVAGARAAVETVRIVRPALAATAAHHMLILRSDVTKIADDARETGTEVMVARPCGGCRLRNPDFRNQDLRDADFSGSSLVNADFRGADLRGAHFDGTSLHVVRLTGAKLGGASLTGASLVGCACAGADFSGARLDGVNFHGADLTRTNFRAAHMTGANFSGAKIAGADFSGANLTGVNVRRVLPP